jgi:hypothetical protein
MAVLGCVAFAAAELFLRFERAGKYRLRVRPDLYVSDPETGYRYKPGFAGLFCAPGVCREIRVNENGWSGRAFPMVKEKGKYRVAVVATSLAVTFATEDDHSFVEILQEQLQSISPRFEMLNFSIDGAWRDLERLRLIKTEVLKYDPDLVIFAETQLPLAWTGNTRTMYRGYLVTYPANHPEKLQEAKEYLDWVESLTLFKALFSVSYVVRAATDELSRKVPGPHAAAFQTFVRRDWVRDHRTRVPETVRLLSIEDSLKALAEVRELLRTRGSRLGLLCQPGPNEEMARQHGFDVLTVKIPTRSKFRLPNGDRHLNRKGHDLLAGQLLPQILAFASPAASTPERPSVVKTP